MGKTLDTILTRRIIAELRNVPPGQAIAVVWALADGGVTCMEVTIDARAEAGLEDALQTITLLKNEFGDSITLGAGDVLSPDQVQAVVLEGAAFIVSPGVDRDVIRKTKSLGLVSIPGAITPTEIVNASAWGADIIRLFPVSFLNVEYIHALKAPLGHIPLFAGGGVSLRNARRLLDAGCAGISAGGLLVEHNLVEAKDYFAIRKRAKEFVMALVNDPPVYP